MTNRATRAPALPSRWQQEGFAFFFVSRPERLPAPTGRCRRDFAERLTAMCGIMIACGRFPPVAAVSCPAHEREAPATTAAACPATGRRAQARVERVGPSPVRESDAVEWSLRGCSPGLPRSSSEMLMSRSDALEAEHWASCLLGALNVGRIVDAEIRERFRADLVRAVEALGSAEALATLRALSGVGVSAERERARAAADRLAASGVHEPVWASGVGAARPVAAALQYEEAFDDGVSVIVEFDGSGDGAAHARDLHRPQHGRAGQGRVPGGTAERGARQAQRSGTQRRAARGS